ncbi:MAG: Intimin-like protein [Candidatus Roizmanbacteria bacterium GW2011_GWC2_37_13]|uniref:Intimin-like protein n=1 Tax=Candidatus Roizmanbacteria bacterium GW2011_GWC2_37_13 TaxID=1618486 RepID=A0A0G0GDN9_9BACT|nr:MAG: Intimin-like protein [Candidatus Roizmanbacteria bacterium GW2011_GWC1_37_12]KKQ24155.1 MAG: Intimin-like protein [Candidatus Roizmanbacteria bacterium GW2011_GWC2_37_13]
MILFVLAFGLFMGFVVFNQPIRTFTRAAEELVPSSESSLIFAWPLTANADGSEKVDINVFVRNAKNLPLTNKRVNLETNLGTISVVTDTTDKSGKASFSLTSSTPGVGEIKATIDNQVQIKQTVTIKFE